MNATTNVIQSIVSIGYELFSSWLFSTFLIILFLIVVPATALYYSFKTLSQGSIQRPDWNYIYNIFSATCKGFFFIIAFVAILWITQPYVSASCVLRILCLLAYAFEGTIKYYGVTCSFNRALVRLFFLIGFFIF